MAFQIKYGGVTLDGLTEWREEIPSRSSPERFPRRQGAIAPAIPFLAERSIHVTGTLDKASESDLKTYIKTLGALLHNGSSSLFLRDDNLYINAVKTGYGYSYKGDEIPTRRARYFVDFVAGDPYWYSTTVNDDTQSNIASSPATFSITNSGGELTPPSFEIKALSTAKTGTFKLTNSTHGLSFQWTGTINAGQLLTIDPATRRVLNGGMNGLNTFAGSFWLLVVGVNNLEYSGPTGVDVTTHWTERWS